MDGFREFVRQDEVSFNPMRKLISPDRGSAFSLGLMPTLAHTAGGILASPVAAAAGFRSMFSKRREMKSGNQYIADKEEATLNLARDVFKTSRDWLINYVRAHSKSFPQWLLSLLDSASKYIHNKQPTEMYPGITVGKQPSAISQTLAVPVALIGSALSSLKSVLDTINPFHTHTPETPQDEIQQNVKEFLLSLDAISTKFPKGKVLSPEFAEAQIEMIRHVVENGGDSSHIDPDADNW